MPHPSSEPSPHQKGLARMGTSSLISASIWGGPSPRACVGGAEGQAEGLVIWDGGPGLMEPC